MSCPETRWIWAAWLAVGVGAAAVADSPSRPDARLDAAKRFVEKSDRYLHHDTLRRGMKGYGLTVLQGTKIIRFQAEIVSVIKRWEPHRDVILARLSGQNLEHTGIISGMSGSPVYFQDPADKKDKLVGAVAYGWRGSKEPLCGIQPITQMLAAGESYKKMGKAPGKAPGKASARADAPEEPAAGGGAALDRHDLADYLAVVLDPRKIDFAELCLPPRRRSARRPPSGAPELVPLTTPLMVSGTSRRTLAELTRLLEPLGIVPVASGGVNAAEAKAARNVRFEPGAALAVPLVTGDAEWSAVGTVTEVLNGRVLAFGHSFAGTGETKLPMGTAYVHTCVSGLMSSFKLSSGLRVLGTMDRDEEVAAAGVIGPKPRMVPVTVHVRWLTEKREETFHYAIADHRMTVASMSRSVLSSSIWAWHEMPERHTVRYDVTVDYGKLGTYRAANVSTGSSIYAVSSDMTRPLATLLTNPYGKRLSPRSIHVNVTVEKGNVSAMMLDFKLAGEIYRPGETLTGTLILRPYRKARETLDVQFKLPRDLPEGNYTLAVSDATRDMTYRQAEQPHRFAPRTTEQLFQAMQTVVQPAMQQLYLRLPLPGRGGLALSQKELPDLPPSRAAILSDAKILDTKTFRRSLVQTVKTKYIISGSAIARFRVQRRPDQTLLRQ